MTILTVIAGNVAIASAQLGLDEAKQRDLEKEARVQCSSGKPEEGVTSLAKLFVETGEPMYLFNQGRCYEENGIYDKAVLRFEEFLRKVQEIADEDRQATQRRIEDLRSRMGEKQRALSAAPSATPSAAPATPVTDSHNSESFDWAHWRDWTWQKKAGVAGIGFGGASLILGGTFHILRELHAGEFRDTGCGTANLTTGMDCQAKYDSVQGTETGMLVGYIGALVLGGGGAVLLLTAPEQGTPPAGDISFLGCGLAGSDFGISCGGQF